MKTSLVALLSLAFAAPIASAQEMRPGVPSVLYYMSIPLDGVTRKDNEPIVGFALQGNRPYQAVRFDTRMMNFFGTGLEAKWILAGALAAGGAVAVTRKDKSVTQQQQQQQVAQQKADEKKTTTTPGTTTPSDPCVCWGWN
jgi:hypothetical protein